MKSISVLNYSFTCNSSNGAFSYGQSQKYNYVCTCMYTIYPEDQLCPYTHFKEQLNIHTQCDTPKNSYTHTHTHTHARTHARTRTHTHTQLVVPMISEAFG